MIRTYEVEVPIHIDFAPWIGEGEARAVNVGPNGQVYLLVAHSNRYRVLEWHNGQLILDVWIENERFEIYDVQPLPTGELVLVSPRSSFRAENDFDCNGRIYSRDGPC